MKAQTLISPSRPTEKEIHLPYLQKDYTIKHYKIKEHNLIAGVGINKTILILIIRKDLKVKM